MIPERIIPRIGSGTVIDPQTAREVVGICSRTVAVFPQQSTQAPASDQWAIRFGIAH
ncbi:hypothetical protein FRUB_02613 [Fimbriiglobus ruber]|uniref:Uncharacterized protein n=1 Tax=Fimbriiglobus ruber TaxID=1908690 RepID=A0A225DTT2_9BACT|nr:hypothetical protein FRUB_02613 [Fimbriiglobus ruber]